jgi:hypothetical protein
VHYLKGEISGTSQVEGVEIEENPWTISSNESGWILRGEDASYTLYDLNGRTLEMGEFSNELHIPNNNKAVILQVRSANHVKSFKLVR